MHKISRQAQQLVKEDAPLFMEAVRSALDLQKRTQHTATIQARLEEFDDNPMLLYACLWFAYSHEVVVLFLPQQSSKKNLNNAG